MALHFSCSFDITDKNELLGIIAKHGEEFALNGFQLDENSYFLELCPGANLEMMFSEGKLEFYCQATPAGPGAHARGVGFVDSFIKTTGFPENYTDDTGYCEHRDYEKLRAAYDDWLVSVLEYGKNALKDKKSNHVAVGWDPNWYYPLQQPGKMLTTTGWLDIEEVQKRIDDKGISDVSCDFFIWYNKEQDALFMRNLALFHTWKDCYFQPSSRSGRDENINAYILALLEGVAEKGGVAFPKSLYLELCALAGNEPVEAAKLDRLEDMPFSTQPGFRRNPLTHFCGNQGVTLPGYFIEGDGDNGNALMFYDAMPENWHGITIWPNPVEGMVQSFDTDYFAGSTEDPEKFELEGARCCVAFMGQQGEGDNAYYTVKAEVISAYQVNFFSISFKNIDEKEWAISVIKNIRVQGVDVTPDVKN